MGQGRSKRHHFVPKALQRSFCVDGDTLYYAEKNSDGRWTEVSRRNISSTFWKRNLYTVNVDGVPSDVVEREFYGKIDDFVGAVFPDMSEKVLSGVRPVFAEGTLHSIQDVVFEMLKRTPDFSLIYDDERFSREYCLEQLEDMTEFELQSERADHLRLLLSDTRRLKEFGRTSRVEGTIGRSELIERELRNYEVRWIVAPQRSSFILSSRNAHRVGNGGSNGFENPDMEIWMPIAPRVCMVLMRDAQKRVPWRVNETQARVRGFNEWALLNSNSVASVSERLLVSLLGGRRK